MSDSSCKPDLNSSENIAAFVEAFYARLLADAKLGPIFVDVAGIDVREHFPRIQAYWEKLLLGQNDYHRHTMNIHRALHSKQTLHAEDFAQWLRYFVDTVDENFAGEKAERAKRIAATIAHNMEIALKSPPISTVPQR
ncbi:group III truncated hemoglobin [Spongiibacter sp. KMU-158]|uniref:Group III truncated hemoglobin n=1 Tax=Spongiibacter pelagi TaxID=2760804 RepID=A0A927C1X2_9GAMM|nr:group III truncated hemoglobin [Spongiibacter pelagi]MBD2858291.1 group III truncated hemoglobin [Spongiibacter pelagi]